MAQDENGNLKPFMLSDLIQIAKKVIDEQGDMPVGVEIVVVGYEYNEEYSLPVSDCPIVDSPEWLRDYWIGRFNKAFVINGA